MCVCVLVHVEWGETLYGYSKRGDNYVLVTLAFFFSTSFRVICSWVVQNFTPHQFEIYYVSTTNIFINDAGSNYTQAACAARVTVVGLSVCVSVLCLVIYQSSCCLANSPKRDPAME